MTSDSGLSDEGFHGQLKDHVPKMSAPTTVVVQLFGVAPERVRRSPSTYCCGRPWMTAGNIKATREDLPVPGTGTAWRMARTSPFGWGRHSTTPSRSMPQMKSAVVTNPSRRDAQET